MVRGNHTAVLPPHLWTQVWKHTAVVFHRPVHTWGKSLLVVGTGLSTNPQWAVVEAGGTGSQAPTSSMALPTAHADDA